MDLLAGYGSDSSSSDAPPPKQPQPTATTKPAAQPTAAANTKPKKKGRRLLSLQAVLPPEILDRLSRPEGEDSDSDSEEKRDAKRIKVGGDRSGVKSLLDELRCATLQKVVVSKKPNDSTTKETQKNEGLGQAFMSYTTESKAIKLDEVVDVHAVKPKSAEAIKTNVSQVPKAAQKRPAFTRISAAAPIPRSMQQNAQPVEPIATSYPIQSEMSTYTPQTAAHQHASHTTSESYTETNNPQLNMNSRKQRREQERSLRSGAAFQNNNHSNTMELHQPSPTEYAPTAHMAAIASRAAHLRNLGNVDDNDTSNYGEYAQQQRKAVGVAMYDPKSGTDVKGGVTGKHKSKHQINQLMVSAMGLEASRAGEAELARLGLGSGGGKASGGRAEAKSKYGW
ncbi:hypothetical protein ACHAXN_005270 [Cyclotella atomus]